MSHETHDNEDINQHEKHKATRKLEDRIDAMNEESDKNAAGRKKDAQDKQQQQNEED